MGMAAIDSGYVLDIEIDTKTQFSGKQSPQSVRFGNQRSQKSVSFLRLLMQVKEPKLEVRSEGNQIAVMGHLMNTNLVGVDIYQSRPNTVTS